MAEALHVDVPLLTVFEKPETGAEPTNTLLYGEAVEILSETGDWLHIKCVHDSYEGYVQAGALKAHQGKHSRVNIPVTHLYDTPDFKTLPRMRLYFGSYLSAAQAQENGFTQLANGGWVFNDHLADITAIRPDIVETASLFLHAPYIWGGRSAAGIDCSGLVQIALMAAGVDCPRDSHQQITLGQAVESPDNLQKGDLVFFEGHVGIMVDASHVLNATARHMRTLIEPLEDLIADYGEITAMRRV